MMTRRGFVALIGAGGIGLACSSSSSIPVRTDAATAPERRPSPGEILHVDGRVYGPDGKTPAPGVTVYVYHTGIDGLYGAAGHAPRYRAWMRTDAEGRYGYRTIVPAPYPGRTDTASHVHTQLWGAGVPVQWNETLYFDGDPMVSPADVSRSRGLGRFAFVIPLALGRDGVWRAQHDLRAKPARDELQAGIRHGIDDAPDDAPAVAVIP